MKWEDTVMGVYELEILYNKFRSWRPLHEGSAIDKNGELLSHREGCYKVNEAQAKISFEAGYKEALGVRNNV